MPKITKTILVLNCGSSSIKFALIAPETTTVLISGMVEALEKKHGKLYYQHDDEMKQSMPLPHTTMEEAIATIFKLLQQRHQLTDSLIGIGHRIVHGGEYFTKATLLTPEVITKIHHCIPLAPLHNPANLQGINACQKTFLHLPQVGIFDTAFHQTMPERAYRYALPKNLYIQQHIRRYGFHGTSHHYVSNQAAAMLQINKNQSHFISAHLGNGCSLCAIANGSSLDTSMGFTPLEGLIMGTRSGDIDPSIPNYLIDTLGWSSMEVSEMLNQQSGLVGLSEYSNDMRELITAAQQGHTGAELAIDIFCYRLAKYIASYWVTLQSVDALIFTGGIGENAAEIRHRVIQQLQFLGYQLAYSDNQNHGKNTQGVITTANSPIAMIIKTDEEVMIAQGAFNVIRNSLCH